MNRRVVTMALTFTLLVAACGGSSDPTEASAGAQEPADALIAALGSDAAAVDALIIAMERGYSGPQILDAVASGQLRGDGTIEGQEAQGSPLGLVLYDVSGEGEGASSLDDGLRAGKVVLAAFLQPPQTPLELLRANSADARSLGENGTHQILALLRSGFPPADVIEALIFGIDEVVDHPYDREGPDLCLRVVDELICPRGERLPAETPAAASDDPATEDAAAPDTEASPAEPMQLLWEGEMVPSADWVENPVAGSYKLTRTPGTDDFQIMLSTADAKSGTFTTDGFNEVECSTEWTSVFEGTGTFWDVNDLGIEFEGQMTRSIVYTGGPCDSVLEPTISDFSGVVVFITEEGIETSLNGWSFETDGSPMPIAG